MKTLLAADLFCGAGGFSSGLMDAAEDRGVSVDLVAVNHWAKAIETHSRNHPAARHMHEDLMALDPRQVVPGAKLDLLLASPECTHHSNARGGKPMSDQSRASAWHILRWCDALNVSSLVIENVREFMDWGPLDDSGRPIQKLKGRLFREFLSTLRGMGYSVDYRMLNAANYGDATTRTRLFVQARKTRSITWPHPSHSQADPLFGTPRWRPARDIIDWAVPSQSIYSRKRPLAENTLRRIFAGIQKFSGLPFVIGQQSCAAPRSVSEPVPTVATAGAISLVQPFLVVLRGASTAVSVDKPAPTLTTSGAHLALCEPYVIPLNHGSNDIRSHDIECPMPTITTVDAWAIAKPYIVPFYTERAGQPPRVLSVEQPLDTITTSPRFGLAQPFLVSYYGQGGAVSVDEPLDTITARDRFALVTPELVASGEVDPAGIIGWLDIHFRMLQPSELAAAMSFGSDYWFSGSREDKVRQIGNAVARRTARALCGCVLDSMGYKIIDAPYCGEGQVAA